MVNGRMNKATSQATSKSPLPPSLRPSLPFPLSPLPRPLGNPSKHGIADSRAWVESGRPGGEHTDRVLQAMRKLDSLVRRSVSDAHSRFSYLDRLATVYGQSQSSIKVCAYRIPDMQHANIAHSLEPRSGLVMFIDDVEESAKKNADERRVYARTENSSTIFFPKATIYRLCVRAPPPPPPPPPPFSR